jgi:HD superfamily phosphohydrolase YqeK
MTESSDFENLIGIFSDFYTTKRSKEIPDRRIKILEVNKEDYIVRAEIQGNYIVPYKINIDLKQETFSSIVEHDCLDYTLKKHSINKFCKHLTKFFYYFKEIYPQFTYSILKTITNKTNTEFLTNDVSFNHFIDRELAKKLNFEWKGFDFFFNFVQFDTYLEEKVKKLLTTAAKLPAALGGYHGDYTGGLYDHILLTTNYTYIICNMDLDRKKAVKTAIFHDFGKIPYYALQKHIYFDNVSRQELKNVHNDIVERFDYEGRDYHVEGTLAVLKKNNIEIDEEMCNAIIFHHGSWSKYVPLKMNKLASIIHVADMISSRVFNV